MAKSKAREITVAGVTYKVHEMVLAFPEASKESRIALSESIKATGIAVPAVTWVDGSGQEWLIDGRNRAELLAEILEAGITHAKSGVELSLPTMPFVGTEAEALNYVMTLNLARRHLTSAMKAGIAVRAGKLGAKYAAKQKAAEEGKKKVRYEEPDLSGDLADQVSREAGTNRTYVFNAAKLDEKAPDLLDAVITGDLSMPDAMKRLKRREAGLPEDGSDPGDGGDGDDKEPKDTMRVTVLKDGSGNPVAPEHEAIFATRATYHAALKSIRELKKTVEDLADGPGGATLFRKGVLSDLNSAARALKAAMPHVPCPYCSGTGMHPEDPDAPCEQCHGAQYIDLTQYKVTPEELLVGVPGGDAPADDEDGVEE